MRYSVAIGLVALACGGTSGRADLKVETGAAGESGESSSGGRSGSSGAASKAGSTALEAGAGGKAQGGGAGAAAGGMDSMLGGAGEAAEAGASPEGGAGGAPAPDDTGCIERPLTGNPGNLNERLPVLDCSGCSNGAELGYTVPSWCGELTCHGWFDVGKIGVKDAIVLLPAATDATCSSAPCADQNDQGTDLPGFKTQLLVTVSDAQPFHFQVDDARGIVRFDAPYNHCTDAISCLQSDVSDPDAIVGRFSLVAKPGAKRGQLRISSKALCQ